MTNAGEAWLAFLNPNVVRTKLISAGLFLVAHEMLKDSILRHPRFFFSNRYTAENGWEISHDYQVNVLSLDPKGKNDELRGSVAWFKNMGAIDNDDESTLKRVTDVRNQIAHELGSFIGGITAIETTDQFGPMMSLMNKIGKWWVLNFEMAVNPDFDELEIEENDVVPGSAWMMDILVRVALGDIEEASKFHRDFETLWQNNGNGQKPSAVSE